MSKTGSGSSKASVPQAVLDHNSQANVAHHLHGAIMIGSPLGDIDLVRARIAGRKQCGMPAEDALGRQWPGVVLRRVEYHVHDTFDLPISAGLAAFEQSKAPGDRGAHTGRIQHLAFDSTGLDDVFRGRRQLGFESGIHSNVAHYAQKPSLAVTRFGQKWQKPVRIPAKLGPCRILPYVAHHHATFSALGNILAAYIAVNIADITALKLL